jgi:CrcB protein
MVLPDVSLLNVLAISAGAVPGALSRYYITEWSKRVIGTKFPYGTFIINITGCLIIGFFITLISEIQNFPLEVRLLVVTGFLGAYTTFSTYEFDTLTMWRRGNLLATMFYWVGSIIFGVICVSIGVVMAHSISR